MTLKNYRGLKMGARLVSGVPHSFKKSSFYRPVLDIDNNAGGVSNEAMNVHLPYRCGIFDLANKTILNVRGKNIYSKLQNLFTGNIYNIGQNKTMDTLLLNESGFVIDKPTIIHSGNDFSIMCRRDNADIITNYLTDDSMVSVENTEEDFDLFAFQGSWQQAGMNKMYYFLNLDFKEILETERLSVKQGDVSLFIKNIAGTKGFVVSIPKNETEELFNKLLHQPNLYMSGSEALKVNKMESRMITDEYLNGKYTPFELNQLSLIHDTEYFDTKKLNSGNKRIMSITFENYNTTKKPSNIYNTEREKIGELLDVIYSPYLHKYKGFCKMYDYQTKVGIYDNKQIELMNIH